MGKSKMIIAKTRSNDRQIVNAIKEDIKAGTADSDSLEWLDNYDEYIREEAVDRYLEKRFGGER
jgi:hypothetical protein